MRLLKKAQSKIVLLTGIALIFSLAACKSAPPAETPPAPPPEAVVEPEKTPTPDPVPDALPGILADASNRAQQARQRALDFDAPNYFPPEWDETEAAYETLNQEVDGAKPDASFVERYEAITTAYDELFNKSILPYALDREEEITDARTSAIAAGADDLLVDLLIQADEKALDALAFYEEEDYYPAKDDALLARDLYKVLKTGAEAYETRLEIEERNLYQYDPDNLDRADDTGDKALAAYQKENVEEAGYLIEETAALYTQILKNGMKALAADQKQLAAEERQAALEVKANVAVRQDFAAADGIYNRAEQSFRSENFDLAVDFYEDARVSFIKTRQDALQKRQLAEDAIKNAESKISESDEVAKNAELTLEGGAE
ncbi:hypothetical protein AGMMS49928_15980 [Spirochaetia bacterium]|nr:hypothetical protein AGMMS49928_15980 [Spirochaetia bacterium]